MLSRLGLVTTALSLLSPFWLDPTAAMDNPPIPAEGPDVVRRLITAATTLDREKILSTNESWLFDFNDFPETFNFAPGGVTTMKTATFPACKPHGMSCPFFLLSCLRFR